MTSNQNYSTPRQSTRRRFGPNSITKGEEVSDQGEITRLGVRPEAWGFGLDLSSCWVQGLAAGLETRVAIEIRVFGSGSKLFVVGLCGGDLGTPSGFGKWDLGLGFGEEKE